MTTDALKDAKDAVIEYAINIDIIWRAPHADTVAGLATHHRTIDRGFDLLRDAIAHYRTVAAASTPRTEGEA